MESTQLSGLTEKQAQTLLQTEGWNELASSKPRSILAIAWQVVSEPMFLLLMGCGIIYLLIGSMQDALILLGSVLVVVGMSFFQERKSERTLEALRDLTSPRALVLRDGEQKRIAGRDVVRGDIIFLSEGDRIPADAILLDVLNMMVDESLLTGESVPVRKQVRIKEEGQDEKIVPGGDDLPYLFSGTLIVQGQGCAQVITTGEKTMLGRIGQVLSSQEAEISRVQSETNQAVKVIATGSASLVVLLIIWYGLTRGDWLNGILAGLTLAMGIMPAEFPLVLVIFLSLGAWRIAKSRVLTRRLPAIEMLGAATALCVDKTGTLTENRMVLSQIVAHDKTCTFDGADSLKPENFDETFHITLEFAMLSSQRDPFDPMEKAIQERGHHLLDGTEHIHESWSLIEEYPLSHELLAMSRVWQSPDLTQYVIAAKGAPEAIFDLCHLSDDQIKHYSDQVDALAAQGLRVIAISKASFLHTDLPPIQHDFDFEFLGIIGLADPLRPNVSNAVKECLSAGIRVIMITGDYPLTARSIAQQAGLDTGDGILTGSEIDMMDAAQLRERIKNVNVFCRATPEQKLQLVNALKENGEIVAMTGDGVNDAPALKAAHIGIAMGERGSDVARESASLVLLDDDFSSMVVAIRLGRRVFDNLRKAIVFVIAAHIPIAGMSLLPVMFGWPLILLPVHIVFFELMMDPTCSIVFEGEEEESDVMSRPPRPTDAKIYDKTILLLGLKQGLALLVLVLGTCWLTQAQGFETDQVRAFTFTAMIVGDIWLIFINRSWTKPVYQSFRQRNPALWFVLGATVLILGVGLFVPTLRNLFHFGAVTWEYIIFSILTVAVMTALLACLPFFRYQPARYRSLAE